MMDRDKIVLYHFEKIKELFNKDYSYITMKELLARDNIVISQRTLERILHDLKLKRKNIEESPLEEIVIAIYLELQGSGYNLGYRSMWLRLRSVYSLIVKQETVMIWLKKLDPEGVEGRRRYRLKRRQYSVDGPNFAWHADGHDKLKRFGFAFYGCIDGYSRKIIWLEVATTNNKPEVIAYQYVEAIEKLDLVPAVIRVDGGTEANIIETIQIALRWDDVDDNAKTNSFQRGPSTHNQRIESLWKQFREQVCDFYIQKFKQMETDNILNIQDKIQIECLRFCFANMIKNNTENFIRRWNQHTIRQQTNRDVTSDKPNELYDNPKKYGAQECKKSGVSKENIQMLYTEYTQKPILYSNDFEILVNLLIPELTKRRDEIGDQEDFDEALKLYLVIMKAIQQYESNNN